VPNNKEINDIRNYIQNIGIHYNVPFLDDYVQEVFLGLYNKGESFLLELKANDKLYNYVYKICVYQLLSINSPYYRTYILPNTFNDLTGLETYKRESFKEEKLNELLNSLDAVDKKLLTQLIECRGVRTDLSRKSNIHYSSLLKMIDRLKNKIKTNWSLNEFYG
jgi:hypothetical protein